jgi:predicted ATPase
VTSLGRLWQQNNRSDEARLMLTNTLDGFTEGFDTRDLKEARVLLNELQIV